MRPAGGGKKGHHWGWALSVPWHNELGVIFELHRSFKPIRVNMRSVQVLHCKKIPILIRGGGAVRMTRNWKWEFAGPADALSQDAMRSFSGFKDRNGPDGREGRQAVAWQPEGRGLSAVVVGRFAQAITGHGPGARR